MATHAFNPSTWEQTGRSQSLLPASVAKSHSFSFRERPCLKSIRPKAIKEVTSYLHLPLVLASTWTRAYPHTYVHALYTHTCTHVCSSTLCSSLSRRKHLWTVNVRDWTRCSSHEFHFYFRSSWQAQHGRPVCFAESCHSKWIDEPVTSRKTPSEILPTIKRKCPDKNHNLMKDVNLSC